MIMLLTTGKINPFVDYTGFPDLIELMSYPDEIRIPIRNAVLRELETHIELISSASDLAHLRGGQRGH
jgi:hypothetical protein